MALGPKNWKSKTIMYAKHSPKFFVWVHRNAYICGLPESLFRFLRMASKSLSGFWLEIPKPFCHISGLEKKTWYLRGIFLVSFYANLYRYSLVNLNHSMYPDLKLFFHIWKYESLCPALVTNTITGHTF